jgi:hypothetical protein
MAAQTAGDAASAIAIATIVQSFINHHCGL